MSFGIEYFTFCILFPLHEIILYSVYTGIMKEIQGMTSIVYIIIYDDKYSHPMLLKDNNNSIIITNCYKQDEMCHAVSNTYFTLHANRTIIIILFIKHISHE